MSLPATEFRTSLEWSRQWDDEIRRIIGPNAIAVADETSDQDGTDFIIKHRRVSSRIRLPGYVPKYQWDITVTCRRETGAKCEWDKNILAKGSDWLFYGHATAKTRTERCGEIFPWYLIDLNVARPWMIENHGEELGPNCDAPGKRCWFYAFDIRRMSLELPHSFLVNALYPASLTIL